MIKQGIQNTFQILRISRSIRILGHMAACVVAACVVLSAHGSMGRGLLDFETRLTAGVDDVTVEFGLVLNHANTLALDTSLVVPPGNYTTGRMVVGMFHSLEVHGAYEVYVTNSTGNIPISSSAGMCVYRWMTTDFTAYEGGDCVLWLPSDGLGDVKTITRNDASGEYFMIWWGPGAPRGLLGGGSPYLFTSNNYGKSWHGPQITAGLDHFNPPNTTIHAKDDINLLFQPGVGIVDLQLFWQQNATIPGGLCDNGGCDKRRVLGTMISTDGLLWNFTGSVRIPGADIDDPPELQFYRSRPFFLPGTRGTRIFAHTLLYAPSPYINLKYGRQPPGGGGACKDPPNQRWCHGPHMYEEWWTLAHGASAIDASARSWRRPARFTKMAPLNAYLFAQPGMLMPPTAATTLAPSAAKMVWLGDGAAYTLPLHRGVGLYAPANGRIRIQPPFNLSRATNSTQLWINANVSWGPPLPQGGCDETCAAYVLAELEDASGAVIDGYDHTSFEPIMDADGINIPLRWNNSTRLPIGHSIVTVKIWFRAAEIYAVYLGDAFDPVF